MDKFNSTSVLKSKWRDISYLSDLYIDSFLLQRSLRRWCLIAWLRLASLPFNLGILHRFNHCIRCTDLNLGNSKHCMPSSGNFQPVFSRLFLVHSNNVVAFRLVKIIIHMCKWVFCDKSFVARRLMRLQVSGKKCARDDWCAFKRMCKNAEQWHCREKKHLSKTPRLRWHFVKNMCKNAQQ